MTAIALVQAGLVVLAIAVTLGLYYMGITNVFLLTGIGVVIAFFPYIVAALAILVMTLNELRKSKAKWQGWDRRFQEEWK